LTIDDYTTSSVWLAGSGLYKYYSRRNFVEFDITFSFA